LSIFYENNGKSSKDLISRFSSVSDIFSSIKMYHNQESLRDAIDRQHILVGIRIPEDFSKKLISHKNAVIQTLLDGRRINASMITQGYIFNIVDSYSKDISISNAKFKNDELISSRVWFNPNLLSLWSSVPALIGILTNLIALLVTSLSVAREREFGTFEQLLVSPLRPFEILIGKAVPAILLGIFEVMIMIFIFILVFKVPFYGSIINMLWVITLFLMATVGIGLFISSISKTQQQGFLGSFTYMFPAVLLSGFATPVSNILSWLRWVAYINPLQYMISASRSIFLEAPGAVLLFHMTWPLIPIGIVSFSIASIFFKKRME